MIELPISVAPHLVSQEPINTINEGKDCWNFSLSFGNKQKIKGMKLYTKEKTKLDWQSVPLDYIKIDNSEVSSMSSPMSFYNFSALKESYSYKFKVDASVLLSTPEKRIVNIETDKYYITAATNITSADRIKEILNGSCSSSNINYTTSFPRMTYDSSDPIWCIREEVIIDRDEQNNVINFRKDDIVRASINGSNITYNAPVKYNSDITSSDIDFSLVNPLLNANDKNYRKGQYPSSASNIQCTDIIYKLDSVSNYSGVKPYWNENLSNSDSYWYAYIQDSTYRYSGYLGAISIEMSQETNIESQNFFTLIEENDIFAVDTNEDFYNFSLYPLNLNSFSEIDIENATAKKRIYAQDKEHLLWKVKMYENEDLSVNNLNYIASGEIQEPAIIFTVSYPENDITPTNTEKKYVHSYTVLYNDFIKVGMWMYMTDIYGYKQFVQIQDIPYANASIGIMVLSVVLDTKDDIFTLNKYNSNEDGGLRYEIYSSFLETDDYYFEIRDKIDVELDVLEEGCFIINNDNNADLFINEPIVDFKLIGNNKNDTKIIYSKLEIRDSNNRKLLYKKTIINNEEIIFNNIDVFEDGKQYVINLYCKDSNNYLYFKRWNYNVKCLFDINNPIISDTIFNLTHQSFLNKIGGVSKLNQEEDIDYYKLLEDCGVVVLGSEEVGE